LGGSGGLGGRQASVVALMLIRISRSQRIGVTIVVAKVSVIGSRRISVALIESLEELRRMGAIVVEMVLMSTQGQGTDLSAEDGDLVRG
jgi:hypothetical protein